MLTGGFHRPSTFETYADDSLGEFIMPVLFKDFLLALFTPVRRLPVFVFIAVKLPLLVAMGVAYSKLPEHGQDLGGLWMGVYAILGWMSYCAVVNRLHDGGWNGLWPTVVYAASLAKLIFWLDPSIAGYDMDDQELWADRLWMLNRFLGLGACTLLGLCIRLPSETCRNRYGMPYGERDWVKEAGLNGGNNQTRRAATSARNAMPVSQGPVARVTRVVAAPLEDLPQPQEPVRRRPAGGFGRR